MIRDTTNHDQGYYNCNASPDVQHCWLPRRGIFFRGAIALNKTYDSMPDLGEIEVYQRADFQSGSRVLKKVF